MLVRNYNFATSNLEISKIMKKLLLLIPSALMAFSAFAQEDIDPATPEVRWTLIINRSNPSNTWPEYELTRDEALSDKYGYDVYKGTFELPVLEGSTDTHTFRYKILCYEGTTNIATINYAEGNGSAYNNTYWNPGDPTQITAFAWRVASDPNAEKPTYTYKGMISSLPYHIGDDKWSAMGSWPYFNQDIDENYKSSIYFNNYKGNTQPNYFHGTQTSTGTNGYLVAGGNKGTISGDRIPSNGVFKATLDYSNGYVSMEKATEITLAVGRQATFVAPHDVELPANITAYELNYADGALSTDKTYIQSDILPANTPVVLVPDEGYENTKFQFTFKSDLINPVGGTGFNTSAIGQYNYILDIEYNLEKDLQGSSSIEDSNYDGEDINGGSGNENEDEETEETAKFMGVLQQHYLTSGFDYYIFDGDGKFSRVDLDQSNPLQAVFSAYIRLPHSEENPETLEVTFPIELPDALYIHFTDSEGNLIETQEQPLVNVGEGTVYSNEFDFHPSADDDPVNPVRYFVISDSNPEILTFALTTDWTQYGNVYHAADSSTDDVTIAKYTGEDLTPFELTPGRRYSIAIDLGGNTLEAQDMGYSTGIQEVETYTRHDSVMYNLLGQPVGNDYKGIVIKNGKKYILR